VAVYFLAMKTFGRGRGSSATSASAYRSGERIRDERTGQVFDHRGRGGVLHTEIVLPDKVKDLDMSWALDRTNLWNTVESAETRSNARVAREFLVALPAELSGEQRLELARGFSQELANQYRFVVDLAVHAPRTDPRNFHAHLLASTREINSSGFGAKASLELNDAGRLQRGLAPFMQEFAATRERWAALCNAALHAAALEARIDHRSLAEQGIDREPRLQLPRPIYEMERRGEYNAAAVALRAQHEARVAARVEQAALRIAQESPTREMQRAGERAPGAVQSLEEIRRQARENWLRYRAERSRTVGASAGATMGAGACVGIEKARTRARSQEDDHGL
jgi:ATP-dependent exoDNAse (exonuclease V) alpha subunit